METMSLVGYKIGYIVNFVPNPDWHLDSKWRSRNRGGGRDLKKLVSLLSLRRGLKQSDVLLLLLKAEVRARSEHGFSMLTSSFASQHDRDARVASADASVMLRSLDRVRVDTGGSKTAHFGASVGAKSYVPSTYCRTCPSARDAGSAHVVAGS